MRGKITKKISLGPLFPGTYDRCERCVTHWLSGKYPECPTCKKEEEKE